MTETERMQAAKSLRELKENIPHMLALIELQATLKMAKFKALVKEGFSEAQAIELCKE